jgi:subtilase family serine protease
MLNSRRLWVVTGLGVALLFGSIRSSLAADRQFLRGHVPEAVSHLQPTGRYPGTNHLNLAIGLSLRNEAALDELLQQIYDPASPNFRHYLTSEQLTERFGPTEQDYQAIIDFAKANGLTVTGTHPNRVILDVSGTVADMERIFHVTMHTYRHPTENRTFFAPDTEPSIDLAIPILHISGLDDFIRPRPMSFHTIPLDQLTRTAPASGSGPSGLYMGNDFRAAYVPGVSLNGSGQVVGLLELDGYYTSDITNYEHQAGLTNVPLQNVLIDSFNGKAGGNNGEVALDIEMAIAMAPGLSNVVVYEEQNGGNIVDMLNRMLTDNLAKQISSSWLIGDNASFDTIYKLLAGQGQSFFQASGDDGAYYSGIGQWADDTNITLVGGTTLTNGPGGAWLSESAWNWYITNPPYTNSTGGGVNLNNIPIPSWQQGINMTTNKGSMTLRNVPDVALTADNIFLVADNGGNYSAGGTSAAAPLWAGFTALVNQQAITLGGTNVGFLNPAIYMIGNGPNYTACFHDITTGNNTNATVGNKYFAVPGYDLCTGWGTPNGMNLINALVTPNSLGIFPGTGFTSSGPVGGPFNVTSQIFSLTNSSGTSLNWSLIGIPPWLGVSSVGGTLPASGSTTVTVNLNSTASNLLAGIYTTNLVFTNMTGGVSQSRQFTLQVGQSLVQNGGFETGDFSFWTLNGDGYNYNYVDNGSTVTAITPHSGSYFAALGEVGFLAYLSQDIPTIAGQPYLLSLWLDSPNVNPTIPNDFLVQWNGNMLFNSTNMGAFAWSNLQFIVTATSSSTILNIGAQDDNYYLGLDDITVTPIPATLFQPVTQTNGAITFSWNAMTGLVYQVQYKTNLLQANWVNLGNAITATNSTLTATNFISSDPQRFYRLLLLP